MHAFALFFTWLALLRRGRFTIREAGLSILVWIEDWLGREDACAADFDRLRNWLSWAEYCARRADPAAARRLLRPDLRTDRSAEAFIARLCAVARVLMGAPVKTPRRKRLGGFMRRRSRPLAVRHGRLAAASRALGHTCAQARAPP
jgi:hypothetical protein